MQEVKLGPCIIPDEPVGKHVLEKVACIKDPDGYTFEVHIYGHYSIALPLLVSTVACT